MISFTAFLKECGEPHVIGIQLWAMTHEHARRRLKEDLPMMVVKSLKRTEPALRRIVLPQRRVRHASFAASFAARAERAA
jgi:hypothetical protein